jgi:cytochrome c556
MRTALEAVGLRMLPQFRRIGGMLADEVPVDTAALHAAIIAINEALDQNLPGECPFYDLRLPKHLW